MNRVTKSQFSSGALWKMLETFSSKGVSFFISIILARLLMPSDYGIIAITAVFLSLTDIFIQGGFNTALVQKKEVDDTDYSTTLIFSLLMATVLYVLLFLTAPFIAQYYEEPLLTKVLRVIGIVLYLQAFSSVRVAKITREMRFKMLCKYNLVGCILSGALGIAAAAAGLGVWALVIQQIALQAIINIALYVKMDFKLKFTWSNERFQSMFKFSALVLLSSLLYYLGDNITNVVVGKVYSVEILGYLSKGDQFPRQISMYTFGAIGSVLLTTFASYQSDREKLKSVVQRVTKMIAFIIFPCMLGMLAAAAPIIRVVLSPKWNNSIEILQWCCVYYAALPVTLTYAQLFYGIGKGHIRVFIEAVRLIAMTAALVIISIVLRGDIYELIMWRAVVSILIMLMSMFAVNRELRYTGGEMACDIGRPLIASVVMAAVVWTLNAIPAPDVVVLCIQLAVGAALYILLSKLMHIKEYDEIKTTLLQKLGRGKK